MCDNAKKAAFTESMLEDPKKRRFKGTWGVLGEVPVGERRCEDSRPKELIG